MKRKLIFVAVLLWVCFQSLEAMIPGPPMLVECPNCGNEKRLMSIISGNTIGVVQWSDMYMEAPMLPMQSRVQKCPECQSYFLLHKAERRYEESDEPSFATDLGQLTYPEMKEALCLLKEDSISTDEEIIIRMEFLHRYNDAFRGGDNISDKEGDPEGQVRTEEDRKLHLANIKVLLGLLEDEQYRLLKVELLRESGDFENSLELLNGYRAESDFEKRFVKTIIMKERQEDARVFLIE